jgi:hypothetical protein
VPGWAAPVQDALSSSHPATTSVATDFTTGVRPAGRAASQAVLVTATSPTQSTPASSGSEEAGLAGLRERLLPLAPLNRGESGSTQDTSTRWPPAAGAGRATFVRRNTGLVVGGLSLLGG